MRVAVDEPGDRATAAPIDLDDVARNRREVRIRPTAAIRPPSQRTYASSSTSTPVEVAAAKRRVGPRGGRDLREVADEQPLPVLRRDSRRRPPSLGSRRRRGLREAVLGSPPRALPRSPRRDAAAHPVPGSVVSTRSSRSAASSVPSATTTMPAWIELPIPTPPPWWTLTQVAPAATLSSAFRIGQSAIASEPSSIASVSRYGRGDRARVEVVAADHDRRSHRARPNELVDREPRARPVAEPEPADPRGSPWNSTRSGASSSQRCRSASSGKRPPASRRSPRCRQGHLRALPSGTARFRGRTAGGYRPGRSPGMRTPPLRPPHGLPSQVVAIIENIAPARTYSSSPRTCDRSSPRATRGTPRGRTSAAPSPRSTVRPIGT